MAKLHLIFVIFSTSLKLSWALPPFESVGEGSCANLQFRPVPIDANFAASVTYFTVGSKFPMYLFASGLPNYNDISELQLQTQACYKSEIVSNIFKMHGFGRLLSTWEFAHVGNFIYFLRINPYDDRFRAECVVSLTDGHSFLLQTCCKTGFNQKEWLVFSTTPHLDQGAISQIKNHVTSLGFDWNKALFLNYDTCPNESGLEHVYHY